MGATAVYFWEDPSCKTMSSSGFANKSSAKEGQLVLAAAAAQCGMVTRTDSRSFWSNSGGIPEATLDTLTSSLRIRGQSILCSSLGLGASNQVTAQSPQQPAQRKDHLLELQPERRVKRRPLAQEPLLSLSHGGLLARPASLTVHPLRTPGPSWLGIQVEAWL